MKNPNCDGAHCATSNGEVRVLPMKLDPHFTTKILCYACALHELRWRAERNRELGTDAQYDVPTWKQLKVYQP